MSGAGDFGSVLREARERRGLSLRQISVATRISIHALEALESNDISQLPGGIFSRGFVRGYAEQVGLDPEETVREFIARFPVESVTYGSPLVEPTHGDDLLDGEIDRRAVARLVALAALGSVVVIAIFYGLFGTRRQPGASASSESPPSQSEPAASAPAATGEPASGGPPPADPALNPPRPPVQDTIDELKIVLEPQGPCWIRVTADGVIAFEGLLDKGAREEREARESLALTVGDAGAFRYTLNGRPGKSLGAPGAVVSVRITPANAAQFMQ
jgi:cytoskeleton protein RodZ